MLLAFAGTNAGKVTNECNKRRRRRARVSDNDLCSPDLSRVPQGQVLSRALEWSAETGSVSTFPVRPLWQLHVAERRLAESLVQRTRLAVQNQNRKLHKSRARPRTPLLHDLHDPRSLAKWPTQDSVFPSSSSTNRSDMSSPSS